MDLGYAEILAQQWSRYGNVKIGGPATGMRGEAFTPGLYLKKGYTITSRGCHNRCWFCSVPKREGTLRELPITDSWMVLDDNLLCCSEKHIRAVFDMLKHQKYRPDFRGGIEAKLLKSWHIELFQQVKPKQIFFAYDTPNDLPPLEHAAKLFREAGYGNRNLSLSSRLGDFFLRYLNQLDTVMSSSAIPAILSISPLTGNCQASWLLPYSYSLQGLQGRYRGRFQRSWTRLAAIYSQNWNDPLQF